MIFISRPDEYLREHSNEVLRQYYNLDKYKGVDKIINNIITKLCEENRILKNSTEIIKEMFLLSIKYHDEGKKNPHFQSYVGNKEFKEYKYTNLLKQHSLISAIYYLSEVNKLIKKHTLGNSLRGRLYDIAVGFACNIEKHHSSLNNLNICADRLENYYKDNKECFKYVEIDEDIFDVLRKINFNIKYENEFTKYIFMKFSYSLLVTCDFLAVYKFTNKEDLSINIIDTKTNNNYREKFENKDIIKNIRSYAKNNQIPMSEINQYRCKIFLEAEKILKENKNTHIYDLPSPTGSGKSLIGMNLALNLIDESISNILYVAPFNNINYQTKGVLDEYISDKNKEIALISCNEEIICEDDNEDKMLYDRDFLDYQLLNYPITLLSHVRLFDILFSEKRLKNLMMPLFCNSVIILDEIQSYKNSLWIHIINTFKQYAETLNVKFIIMSATLPKMEELLESGSECMVELIHDKKYYYDFFKQRVKCDFTLLNGIKTNIKQIYNKIDYVIKKTDQHRILIEVLTVDRSEEFYEYLNEKYENEGFLIFKMTSDTKNMTRESIIKEIQLKEGDEYKNKKIILIGTQCIEAGIDIDIDVGFKDISILDSEEQFIGRIKRNFKGIGIAYFFNLDDQGFIYKGDYRTDKSLHDKEMQEILENKYFDKFYKRNYIYLKECGAADDYKEFKNKMESLQYEDVSKMMRLIESENVSLFLDVDLINENGEVLKAKEVLNEYIKTKNNNTYAFSKKQIMLSRIKKQLNNFIENISTYKIKNISKEKVDNFYIIENGQDYYDNKVNECKTVKSNLNLNKLITEIDLFV